MEELFSNNTSSIEASNHYIGRGNRSHEDRIEIIL